MLIHELTHKPAKINEDLKSFFGLNNPAVAAAWDQIGGELTQDLAARFTRDPRYAKMSQEQRKAAIAQDQALQQQVEKKNSEWNNYVANLQVKAGAPLSDDQYKAALLNWANQSLFNGQFSKLDSEAKNQADIHLGWIAKNRNNPVEIKRMFSALLANETARMVTVATDLQKAQAAMNPPTTPPAQPTTAAPAAPAASTVSFGGEPQNPNDPATAKLLAMAKAQGKA
jgi:hypothetical protein